MKCEMVESKLPNPVTDQSVDPVRDSQRIMLKSDKGLDFGVESSTNASPLNSSKESTTSDERHVSGQWEEEDVGEINGTSTISNFNLGEELEVGKESSMDSSSKDARISKMNEKKAAPKRKKDKSPKLNIPGSSNKYYFISILTSLGYYCLDQLSSGDVILFFFFVQVKDER